MFLLFSGTNGKELCIANRDSFRQFTNQEVEEVLVREIRRPALQVQPVQPARPAKMSCREFFLRALGCVLLSGLRFFFVIIAPQAVLLISSIETLNLLFSMLDFFLFINDILEEFKYNCSKCLQSLPLQL